MGRDVCPCVVPWSLFSSSVQGLCLLHFSLATTLLPDLVWRRRGARCGPWLWDLWFPEGLSQSPLAGSTQPLPPRCPDASCAPSACPSVLLPSWCCTAVHGAGPSPRAPAETPPTAGAGAGLVTPGNTVRSGGPGADSPLLASRLDAASASRVSFTASVVANPHLRVSLH